MEWKPTLAKVVQSIIVTHGSQTALARASGLTQQAISLLANGQRTAPEAATVAALLRVAEPRHQARLLVAVDMVDADSVERFASDILASSGVADVTPTRAVERKETQE